MTKIVLLYLSKDIRVGYVTFKPTAPAPYFAHCVTGGVSCPKTMILL